MAAPYLFEPIDIDRIRAALRAAGERPIKHAANYDKAIDVIEGRQLETVRAELARRYESVTNGPAGEGFNPVSLPIAERFLAESADIYSEPVERSFVDESGEPNDDVAKFVIGELDRARYDRRMRKIESLMALARSGGIWWQARRGMLKPRVVYSNAIYPVLPADSGEADPADANDHLGFVVALNERNFVLLTRAEHIYFKGEKWSQIGTDESVVRHANPFKWEQVADTDDNMGTDPSVMPGQMLTVWSFDDPVGELFPSGDADIVTLGIELSVQLSVLLDTLRVQGYGQLVANVMAEGVGAPPPEIVLGTRKIMSLMPNESASVLNFGNNYTDMVGALVLVTKLMAMAKRLNPSVFSIEPGGPESGFARMVANLPKIRERNQRAGQMKHLEEQVAWPRIASVLNYLGNAPDDLTKYQMRVKYRDIEYPLTADERSKSDEHDFKWGMRNPIDELARQRGVGREEAEKIYTENKALTRPGTQDPGGAPQQVAGRFGGFVAGNRNAR